MHIWFGFIFLNETGVSRLKKLFIPPRHASEFLPMAKCFQFRASMTGARTYQQAYMWRSASLFRRVRSVEHNALNALVFPCGTAELWRVHHVEGCGLFSSSLPENSLERKFSSLRLISSLAKLQVLKRRWCNFGGIVGLQPQSHPIWPVFQNRIIILPLNRLVNQTDICNL